MGALGTPDISPQTASRSNQPLLQNTRSLPSDRRMGGQTDRPNTERPVPIAASLANVATRLIICRPKLVLIYLAERNFLFDFDGVNAYCYRPR